MRTEQPKMIYLKDYQAPEYLIDETHLTFELFEDHTLVHAQLVMRRNPQAGSGLPPLVLDGQQLELLSLAVDDVPLAQAAEVNLDARVEHRVEEGRAELRLSEVADVRMKPQRFAGKDFGPASEHGWRARWFERS